MEHRYSKCRPLTRTLDVTIKTIDLSGFYRILTIKTNTVDYPTRRITCLENSVNEDEIVFRMEDVTSSGEVELEDYTIGSSRQPKTTT